MTIISNATADAKQRSRSMRQALQQLANDAYRRHPVLAHQDALGLCVLIGSGAAILGAAWLYAYGALPAWGCVVLAAFFMSLLHELEHDLIHRLYFKDRPWLYNAALLTVWLFRPSTINPWLRRDWHLHHHRASGTSSDIEERGVTNGEIWGIRRLLMTLDPLMALMLRPRTIYAMLIAYTAAQKPVGMWERRRVLWRSLSGYLPFGLLYSAAWHACLILHAVQWVHARLGIAWQVSASVQATLPVLDFLAVTLLLPNVLRTACLYFVSSNIHYYGDIEARNVVQQTQVWTAPWLWPVQLFCFNFGSTHAIHHCVVQQPFYVRQLIAAEAHQVLREHGVRFNDFSSMARANRWHVVH